jgi:hypothetical protein
MKKHFGLILIVFGFIYNCPGQTKTIIRKNHYELQSNSDLTCDLQVVKGRSMMFTMILDDRDTFSLRPRRFATSIFRLKNIPKGDHKIVFINNEKRFKDSLNYTFQFQSNGNRETIKLMLPKRRYNNRIQVVHGFAYAIDATFIVLLATIKGAE